MSEDEDDTGRTPEGRWGDCLQRQHQVSFHQSAASSTSGRLTRANLSPHCLILSGRLVTTGNQKLPDCSKLNEVPALCQAAAPHAGPPLPQTRSVCSPTSSGPDPGSPPPPLCCRCSPPMLHTHCFSSCRASKDGRPQPAHLLLCFVPLCSACCLFPLPLWRRRLLCVLSCPQCLRQQQKH